jgi:phosphopantothenoylcysteine decarboxylase/phosphopantothenate--cysteine ligase
MTRESERSRPAAGETTLPVELPAANAGLAGRHVTLCVTGSIAAYKTVLLVRELMAEGAIVDVILSQSAREFVGPATFSGLTGRPVLGELFEVGQAGELHVELGAKSDLILVVPATADVLARMAQGRASDLTSALVLCARCPVLVAPAMHPTMWTHPATERNVAQLTAYGRVTLVGPVEGPVASGEVGMGRMAEPSEIARAASTALSPATLRGVRVLVTAGPTAEDIDPVRYVGNRSSGKMGFAVAERAALRGATVTLVAGPVGLATPAGVTRVNVRSAESMRAALWDVLGPELSGTDALVMAAAVADFRPAAPSDTKLRRGDAGLTLELVQNPDILAEIGRTRQGARPLLVGFALGTESDERAVATARTKLVQKQVDLVVSNHADESIGRDDIRAMLIGARSCEIVERTSKRALADRILDVIALELSQRRG